MLLVLVDLLLSTLFADAAPTTRIVAPDLAGMIFPSTSVSQHVQFGDVTSSFSPAFEFIPPVAPPLDCTGNRICLELQLSSVFEEDPFILYRYDVNTPVTSASFAGHEAVDILPLIPGSRDGTYVSWWFQSNTMDNSLPEVDLLLRLRQRSQRPSTRDQLLVQIKIQLANSHTATSAVKVYSIYGNQRVTTGHTRRIDSNTVQVAISISKNDEKREVGPGDAYPLVASENLGLSSTFGTSCGSCGDFLDACDDIEVCKSMLLPCLLSQLEGMAANGSGDSINGRKQMDLLQPLATCAANYPVAAWAPIRKAIFCLDRFQCPLGTAEGGELPATLRLTNGTQKFTVVPLTMGTDFVDLTIETNDIRSTVADSETFTYSASASFLDTFLRSFVLSQSAKVSVFVENFAADLNHLEVTLNYSEVLMLKSVEFRTTDSQVNMLQDSPAQAFIKYPDSSFRPNLDIILDEIRARVNPPSHSWILSDDCLACSAQLFDCSTEDVANNSCNYYTMTDKFGKCMQQQVPPALFKAMINGTTIKRPITVEISRCLENISTSTSDNLPDVANANSRLACFAATQCPFGPIALVQDARAIVLETTSYIQLIRITRSSMTTGIKIKFNAGHFFSATSASILAATPGSLIHQIIEKALSSTGIGVTVSTSTAGREWTLDIIYRNVFFGEKFTINAVVDGNSAGSDTINQIVMKGGASQLLTVARDVSKIFKESTAPAGTLKQGDVCRKCAPAIARCLDKTGCKSFVWKILVPSLRKNNTNYQLDLVPTLESILPDDFDYWNDIAAEFYCLAEVHCDLEYDSVLDTSGSTSSTTTSSTTTSSTAYHRPTYLRLNRIHVKWKVRTYVNTQWVLTTSSGNFTYNPDTTGTSVSTEKSAETFMDWLIKTITNETGMNCQQAGNWSIDGSGAVGVIDFFGPYDPLLNRAIMAPLKSSLSLRILETSPISTTLPPPEVIVTPWILEMISSGTVQLGKLLDLLKYGTNIVPSDSTGTVTTSPTKFILPTDPCRSCSAVSVQCQSNLECLTFSRGPLVSLLRQARDRTAIDLSDEHGNVRIAHPLSSDLYSLASTKLHSLEGWRVLTSELSCFAQHCDLEYRDILSPEQKIHDPSYLSIDKRTITLIVTTSADTEWKMEIPTATVTMYAPSSSLSLYDAAVAFRNWIKDVVTQTTPCVFTGGEPAIDETTATATFEFTLDTPATENSLMSKTQVPVLEATGGTTTGAQMVVKPWELSLWAVNHKPQYSKLIDLLALGFVEVPYTSGTSQSPTSTPTGSGAFECAECTENLRVCREDSECEAALQVMVILFYGKMIGSSMFDATTVMKETIFHSIPSTEARVKLLQLLTCSSLNCIQKSCDFGEPGETAQLKMAPALTKFYVKEGDNITIHGVQNDTYEYTENNDAAALASYLDTTVLSSYAALNIRVTATVTEDILDNTLQVYVITFEGLDTPLHFTWRNTPPDSLFADSFDSFTAFTFNSSSGDMLNAFQPWLDWVSTVNSGPPMPAPAPPPNIAVLESSDSCRRCTFSLFRCKNNDDCLSSSRNSLLPFLWNSLKGATYSNNQVNLGPILQAFGAYDPHAFSSKEAWHALSAELYCLAHSDCDPAYDDGNDYNSHVFSVLKMEVMSVTLAVRTYADTKWKVDLNGTTFYYTPYSFMPPGMPEALRMAVLVFQNWIKQLGESLDMEIHIDGWEEDEGGSVRFYVKLDGGYDAISDRYTLLSPVLIPVFSVVEDATGGDPPASVATRPWMLYFWSPERPKYGKFLDLLGYGISGATASAPTPTSTLHSPSRNVAFDDQCNKCASVFARCQADSNCVSLSAEVVSLLQSTSLTLETESIDAFGSAAYTGDLYPALLGVGTSSQNVGFAWDLIAAELSCLTNDPCNVEYSDVHVIVEGAYTPVVVDLSLTQASVDIELRTYADTPVEISVNNHQFIYTPLGGDITEAAIRLRSWLEALNDDASMPLEVQVVQTRVDTQPETPTSTLSVRFFGAFDEELHQYVMVNPMLFPSFTTTTTSSRTDPFTPDLNTTVPKLLVSSKYAKPQYSRMLDMLSNGISESPSPSPETSAARTIQADDPCRNCTSIVSSCRDDVDCLEATQNSLASLLTSSEMRMSAVPISEDGVARVSLNMSSALYSTVLRASDGSYSSQAWTLLLDELSCLSGTLCDLEYDDVVSPFLLRHVPTSLIFLEPSVIISLRTFISTSWTMWVADTEYSYPGSSAGSIQIAAESFRDWIITKLSVSNDLEVYADDLIIDSEAQSATVTLHYHRTTSTPTTQMVPPWQVPRFEAVGGTVGGGDTGLPAVYAKVKLWEIEMTTTGQKPQFGKFVDILTNGLSE